MAHPQSRNTVYNTRMRIGLFADMYLPHISGVTNHLRLYKRYFEQQGHEVFLVTFGATQYRDDEPNIVRNPAVPWGKTGWNYGPAFNRATRKLIPTLDIIHTHHPFQSGSYLLRYAKDLQTPLVLTNHTRFDLYADTYVRTIPPIQRHKLLARYLNYFTKQCNLVIAPSTSIADWLAEYVQYRNAQVIPNGIDLQPFQNGISKASSEAARNALGISADDVLFCYVGRVSHEKNIAYLLREFTAVSRRNVHAKLLLVGGGTEMVYVQNFISQQRLTGRIILTGPQDYKAIPTYTALADAFITGSVSEVHPLVVVEALAAELPVIAVASPGISDTIKHGKSGLLAIEAKPGALLTEAEKIITDEALRLSLSEGAAAQAQHYDLDSTAGLLLAKYEDLLS